MSEATQDRLAACIGKESFATRAHAQKQADWMQREARRSKRRQRFTVYQCKFCQEWHVGVVRR